MAATAARGANSGRARRLTNLRQAFSSATSHQQLQERVQQLFGPNAGLSPVEQRTPIGELRPMLLARAEQASRQLMQQIEAQAAIKPVQLLKESLRIAISAVAYAIGFAFLAGVLRGEKRTRPSAARWWMKTISTNWRGRGYTLQPMQTVRPVPRIAT